MLMLLYPFSHQGYQRFQPFWPREAKLELCTQGHPCALMGAQEQTSCSAEGSMHWCVLIHKKLFSWIWPHVYASFSLAWRLQLKHWAGHWMTSPRWTAGRPEVGVCLLFRTCGCPGLRLEYSFGCRAFAVLKKDSLAIVKVCAMGLLRSRWGGREKGMKDQHLRMSWSSILKWFWYVLIFRQDLHIRYI